MGGGGGRAREREDEWASTTHLVSSLRTSHHRHRLKSQLAIVDARGILFVICWEISLSTEELCARDWSGGGRRTSLTKSKWRFQISATSKEVTRRRVRWTLKFESDSNERILSSLDMLRFSSVVKRRRHCLNFSFLIHFTLSQLHSAAARSFDLIKRKHGHNARSDYKFIL